MQPLLSQFAKWHFYYLLSDVAIANDNDKSRRGNMRGEILVKNEKRSFVAPGSFGWSFIEIGTRFANEMVTITRRLQFAVSYTSKSKREHFDPRVRVMAIRWDSPSPSPGARHRTFTAAEQSISVDIPEGVSPKPTESFSNGRSQRKIPPRIRPIKYGLLAIAEYPDVLYRDTWPIG